MEEPTKKGMAFKSQKVRKIWGSALKLKYLPELLEELEGDRDDVESQVVT